MSVDIHVWMADAVDENDRLDQYLKYMRSRAKVYQRSRRKSSSAAHDWAISGERKWTAPKKFLKLLKTRTFASMSKAEKDEMRRLYES